MSIGIYDQVYAYVNGGLLAENISVTVELVGTDEDVMTIVKGLSGFTPGPDSVKVTFSNVVPASGFEFNAWNAQLNKEIVELKLQFGGSGMSLTSEGRFSGNKIDAGVSKTTGYDFDFTGSPAPWEGGVGL